MGDCRGAISCRGSNRSDPLILDLYPTLVTSLSDEEMSVGTDKGRYGFTPFFAGVDDGAGNNGGLPKRRQIMCAPGTLIASPIDGQTGCVPFTKKRCHSRATVRV